MLVARKPTDKLDVECDAAIILLDKAIEAVEKIIKHKPRNERTN
jgi:hypothetical protein